MSRGLENSTLKAVMKRILYSRSMIKRNFNSTITGSEPCSEMTQIIDLLQK